MSTMSREKLDQLLTQARAAALTASSDAEAAQVVQQIKVLTARINSTKWTPYPWQHPHVHPEGWGKRLCDESCYDRPRVRIGTHQVWLQLGGRGTGKTEGAARYVNAHMMGPACDPRAPGGHRAIIVAPTQGDAMEACVDGLSGLRTINPMVRSVTHTGGTTVRWPNGARARVLGAYTRDDENRLRSAGNSCLVWLEEAAAMKRLADARTHTTLGLRVGGSPHFVASTTPKPRKEVRALIDESLVITRGSTAQATRLDETTRASYVAKYGGTRLGRQELGGELLEDVEGALWSHDYPDDGSPIEKPAIEPYRVDIGAFPASRMHRTIVAVDPNGGTAECGIQVLGSIGDHAYLLADLSGVYSPEQWARIAVEAVETYGASGIAVEKAYGGSMVTSTIRTVSSTVPIYPMPTKVGKRLRAEPVQAIGEQGRLHYVGGFPETEDQMTSWVPDSGEDSPDRLDAFVHGVTFLLIKHVAAEAASPATAAAAFGSMPSPARKPS